MIIISHREAKSYPLYRLMTRYRQSVHYFQNKYASHGEIISKNARIIRIKYQTHYVKIFNRGVLFECNAPAFVKTTASKQPVWIMERINNRDSNRSNR